MASPGSVTVVGRGRAGGAFATALRDAGWSVRTRPGRPDAGPGAADAHRTGGAVLIDSDLVLVCVPDAAVAPVASTLRVAQHSVVAHCAGSLGTDALAPHRRRGSIHPLVALPDAAQGAARLRGAWFACAGDPLVEVVASTLGGRTVAVADEDRRRYHAAACVAANHLVALMSQVERLAPPGVPLEAYLDLARGALDDVAEWGPAAALTGPVARNDLATVAGHLADIDERERAAYLALADLAARLAGTAHPSSSLDPPPS